jgi:UDP-N-acetylglucosamine pyrophosphorylase
VLGIDEHGRELELDATQFESFVFDALPLTRRQLNVETRREREFAPAKNLEGVDSVETSRTLLMDEHRRWLSSAGITARGKLEIDPIAGISPDDLAGDLAPWKGEVFEGALLISRGEDGGLSLDESPDEPSSDDR